MAGEPHSLTVAEAAGEEYKRYNVVEMEEAVDLLVLRKHRYHLGNIERHYMQSLAVD